MAEAPNLLEAGLTAMRTQAEQDALDRIAAGADEAAQHALAQFGDENWLDVDFAQALLTASRALRQVGRNPSPAVVEAMERCTAAHHAWEGVWADQDEVEAQAHDEAEAANDAVPAELPALENTINDEEIKPVRLKVGLGEIVKGVLKARGS